MTYGRLGDAEMRVCDVKRTMEIISQMLRATKIHELLTENTLMNGGTEP
ncbi:hypothetical protein ACFQZT_20010 [Paenibacillus sp. GCM10027628]